MTFELQYTDPKSNARAGLITTDHGQIETPIFMPVGTLGTVKGVHLHEIKDDRSSNDKNKEKPSALKPEEHTHILSDT